MQDEGDIGGIIAKLLSKIFEESTYLCICDFHFSNHSCSWFHTFQCEKYQRSCLTHTPLSVCISSCSWSNSRSHQEEKCSGKPSD